MFANLLAKMLLRGCKRIKNVQWKLHVRKGFPRIDSCSFVSYSYFLSSYRLHIFSKKELHLVWVPV